MRFAIAGVFVAAALAGFSGQAQRCPYVVEGVVKDERGDAIQEAYVLITGTQLRASTDVKGFYRIRIACAQVPAGARLRFLRIGSEQTTRELSLGRDSVVRVDVAMKSAATQIMGVTVISIPDAEEFARRASRYADLRARSEPATIGRPFDRVSVTAIRNFLQTREFPPTSSFGVEGLIQHPDVQWPTRAKDASVALVVDEIPAPWAAQRTLVRASLVARPSIPARSPRNVVLVIGASGDLWHLLPRVRQAIGQAVLSLDERDRVSIVVFRGPRDVLLSGASGREHARIRSALDSLESGRVIAESNILTIAERVAASSAVPGLESHIVLVTDEGGIGNPLGSENLIADVRRIRANGNYIDVIHLDDESPSDRMRAIALGGGGSVFDGSRDASFRASLGRIFDVAIPLRATRPSFTLAFDARRVARWRCLNDIGVRETSSTGRKTETLYAGAAVTVLCETEPRRTADDTPTKTRVTATYLDAIGTKRSVDAESAPDSLLRDETRLIAHAAGFGLWLGNASALGPLSVDSLAAGIDDRGGYAAELRRLVMLAKERRR